ncbi:hypothetical protein Pelo_10655 [Pelomyxa schiedti]|nr:hypothetical protein Pelo_10655 [Pelomyxa schiedti]
MVIEFSEQERTCQLEYVVCEGVCGRRWFVGGRFGRSGVLEGANKSVPHVYPGIVEDCTSINDNDTRDRCSKQHFVIVMKTLSRRSKQERNE